MLGDQPLDDAVADEPEVASLVRESVADPSNRMVDPAKARPVTDGTTRGAAPGLNLHAGTALGALDRDGRERLARYLLRPTLSDDRLTLRDHGKAEMALKTPWRDGSLSLVWRHSYLDQARTWSGTMASWHQTRLAGQESSQQRNKSPKNRTSLRILVMQSSHMLHVHHARGTQAGIYSGRTLKKSALDFFNSASPKRRVFSVDVLDCAKCGGRLRLVAAIIDGISARRSLEGAGLAEPRPGVAARAPPTERRVA